MTDTLKKEKILIVDDMSSNIKVIGETLRGSYDICFARSGNEALAAVDDNPPDLILLDIMMPGIDGYEVCRRIRAQRKSKDIPIIFITAKDDACDEARGFNLGAVDYITKPFNPEIVKARVKTHLELKRHRDHLSDLVKERTGQLIHSDRLATLGTISAAVAHEIKNPLFYISANAELITQYIKTGNQEKALEKLNKIIEGTRRINRLIEYLRGYSRKKELGMLFCLVRDIVRDAVDLISHRLKQSRVTLNYDSIAPDLKVCCDFQRISQVVVNLIGNALDAIGESEGEIRIRAESMDQEIMIKIADNGPGIGNDVINSIFEPFFTSKTMEQGTGLGLFIAKHLIEEHDGRIFVSQNDKTGAEFTIALPLKKDGSDVLNS